MNIPSHPGFRHVHMWKGGSVRLYPITACSCGPPGAQQSSAVSIAGTPPKLAAALPVSAKFLSASLRLAAAWLSSSALNA